MSWRVMRKDQRGRRGGVLLLDREGEEGLEFRYASM